MALVSIIIPIFNVEQYLNRCIASVANQTYRDIQIVLVDDGSTDRSSEICDSWAAKDSRVTVAHQANGGVSVARNHGLDTATGEYILWVDSDDYIAPETVEIMMRAALQNHADMVICDFEKGTDDCYAFDTSAGIPCEQIDNVTALTHIYTDAHSALRYAAPWAKLAKRSLYQGIRYPEGKIFEDIYTTHKLLLRCDCIAVLDIPMFYYFQRPDSIMNAAFSMKKLDYLQALVERIAFFKEHSLDDLECIAYDELLHSLLWEYSRTRDLLHNEEGMTYIKNLFRATYRKGHASRRYPGETKWFLAAFNANPEWIILFWKIRAKLKRKG